MRTKPYLACCDPFRRPWPSGLAWTHSRKCALAPGQKVVDDRAALVALNRRFRAETSRTGLGPSVRPVAWLRPDEPHHECKANWIDGDASHVCSRCAPLLHPGTCDCWACDYLWSSTDDNDDDGRVWA